MEIPFKSLRYRPGPLAGLGRPSWRWRSSGPAGTSGSRTRDPGAAIQRRPPHGAPLPRPRISGCVRRTTATDAPRWRGPGSPTGRPRTDAAVQGAVPALGRVPHHGPAASPLYPDSPRIGTLRTWKPPSNGKASSPCGRIRSRAVPMAARRSSRCVRQSRLALNRAMRLSTLSPGYPRCTYSTHVRDADMCSRYRNSTLSPQSWVCDPWSRSGLPVDSTGCRSLALCNGRWSSATCSGRRWVGSSCGLALWPGGSRPRRRR